ncbi:MAG: hypothetical protein OXT70_13155 [Chloroflexota bacterium]|nr:hypothetical protein [Chloroflexota bacterium]
MESAETTAVGDGLQPEAGAGDGTALREAMLDAIGELSADERDRIGSAEEPDDLANAWRDLIAERAAREREATVRSELTRDFERRARASQPRPTSGLRGGPPAAQPDSVAEWTDFIRSSDDEAHRQRRRAQFADWLARHPEA